MKKMNIAFILLTAAALSSGCNREEQLPDGPTIEKSYVDDWQEGYMDIHQISTGRGNVAWLILPDGTTMLVDMGDLGKDNYSQEIMEPKPSGSKSPAQWVAQYIKHFSAPLENGTKIDYAFMTHFHGDHIGGFDETAISSPGLAYKLHGITHLAQLVDIDKIVDRGWPDYNYPTAEQVSSSNGGLGNYRSFMSLRSESGKPNEKFVVGSDTQFPLKHDAASYPEFSVRNVAGNLDVWTGSGTGTRHMSLSTTDENEFSCAIRISYGDFSWYTGGDIKSELTEDAVAKACGPTDVVVCNHHAYKDAMHSSFISQMQAKAYLVPVWDYYHPESEPLKLMLSDLYPGDRMVFAAGLVENNRIRLGENGEKIKPAGHIMVRVYEGGKTWQVFVLNDTSTDYNIIYKTDILQSK